MGAGCYQVAGAGIEGEAQTLSIPFLLPTVADMGRGVVHAHICACTCATLTPTPAPHVHTSTITPTHHDPPPPLFEWPPETPFGAHGQNQGQS